MDKVNRVLCEKMIAAGCNVMFRAADKKWVFLRLNPETGLSDEQAEKLRENGINFIEYSKSIVFYYADDYEVINNNLTAKKDSVKSFPVSCSSTLVSRSMRVVAKQVDLTEFCGVVMLETLTADELIIGNDVRNVRKLFQAAYDLYDEYAKRLLGERSYHCLRPQVSKLKVVGNTPITTLRHACGPLNCLHSVDFSEANLKECLDLHAFCAKSRNLQEVSIGEICTSANCSGAFEGADALPSFYNSATLSSNELVKIQAMQKKVPALYVKLDDPNLKIASTNLSAEAMESVFTEYTCKILPYQCAEDSIMYPYAFLFRKGVPITAEVYEYLSIHFPELVQQLTGKTLHEALQLSNVF